MASFRWSGLLIVVLVLVVLLATSGGVEAGKRNKDHDRHHHDRDNELSTARLSALWTERAQCQRCVRDNGAFDGSGSSSDTAVPDYAPQMVMQWCPNTMNNDFDGSCQASCSGGIPGVSTPSSCHGDDASSKLTCSLCVMDGYYWTYSRTAKHDHDEYNGTCSSTLGSNQLNEWSSSSYDSAGNPLQETKTVNELKSCVKLATPRSDSRAVRVGFTAANFFLVIYFWATVFLACCCLCQKAFTARSNLARQRAANMLAANQTNSGATQSLSTAPANLNAPLLANNSNYPAAAAQLPVSYAPPAHPAPSPSLPTAHPVAFQIQHPQSQSQIVPTYPQFTTAATPAYASAHYYNNNQAPAYHY